MPLGDFMIIALPNLDGSFTVTLFLSYESGAYNFNNLTAPEIVTEFFKKEFPDALDLMPNLVEEFFENPTAPLGTIRSSPVGNHIGFREFSMKGFIYIFHLYG